MDQMVLKTQQFLNAMYGGNSGYSIIPENGLTGWTTIYALTRALQIELGIVNTADSFGPATKAAFESRFPNGVIEQDPAIVAPSNINAIIQGGLWCKGYSTGATGITLNFYSGTGSAVKQMKADAGLLNPNSTVTLNVMESLLSMKQYKLVLFGLQTIRNIQQKLNQKYEAYIGLSPCDGLYGRDMCLSMIKALQAVEGILPPTGTFGDQTKSLLPMLPDTQSILPAQKREDAVALVHYALVCNGYSMINWDSNTWTNSTTSKIEEFQTDMCLPVNGKADTNTWMSLFLSKGNPDRAAIACDTRFEMTPQNITTLKNLGYQIVGRYLTGTEFKVLRDNEPQNIIQNGLKFFPIFQESGTDISYFTPARGEQDAYKAVRAARKFRIPEGTVIYFATDLDPQDPEITSKIIPYFEALHNNMDSAYEVGIYGTRNVCTRVCSLGYAVTSFVSNMSTGYSGNMGFKMPQNWTYDQFAEIAVSPTLDIDKDGYSGYKPPVDHLDSQLYTIPSKPSNAGMPNISTLFSAINQLETLYVEFYQAFLASLSPIIIAQMPPLTKMGIATAVTSYLRKNKYVAGDWSIVTGRVPDPAYLTYVQNEAPALYTMLEPFISDDDHPLADSGEGIIDLAHFAATLECYLDSTIGLVGFQYFAGWGGDVASGTIDVVNDSTPEQRETGDFLQLANERIGAEVANCNYSDLCCDSDAIKISEMIKSQDFNYHPLSSAMASYYASYAEARMSYFLKDLNCNPDLTSLKAAVRSKMIGIVEGFTLWKKGTDSYEDEPLAKNALDSLRKSVCDAFANYIYAELK